MRPASDARPGGTARWFVLGVALFLLAIVTQRVISQETATAASAAASLEQALTSAIDKAGKSVVAIARVDPLEKPRNGDRIQPQPRTPADADFVPDHFGTGVVIDRGGFIVTQHHVVREGSEHYVTTVDRKVYRVQRIDADPRSDLAVLKIDATDLTPIRFGDTSGLKRGQIAVALGNPYAIARDGQASASWGIIANLSRKVPPGVSEGAGTGKDKLHHFGTLIQTDAKLNLGTSGGALVNLKGEMIGLTTSLAATAGYEQAAGYAIPVDDVFLRAVNTMKRGDEVEYGFLGVRPESLPIDERAKGLAGVRVLSAVPGTPADHAGVRANDLISHVNGQQISIPDDLMLAVGRKPVESLVRLTILRDSRPREIDVKLTKFPVRGAKIVTRERPAWRGLRVDYYSTAENLESIVNPDLLRGGCVLITDVERDSPAWEAKLQPGMFVSEVGGRKIASPQEFHTAILGKNGPIEIRVFAANQLKQPEPRIIKPASG
jgi:serine protease Do